MKTESRGHCKKCGCDLDKVNASYGEQKTFLWFKYWVRWCQKCYFERFCQNINSSPEALNRYWQIYGHSPETEIFTTVGVNE